MRFLIATTILLAIAGLVGLWAARRHHRVAVGVAAAMALCFALVLVAGIVAFPRETCELMGGNLTGYDSGACVNEWGGSTTGGIG